MPTITVDLDCQIAASFRAEQVRGMFGLLPAARFRRQFNVEVPADHEDWSIGAIVGPAGSGKTTIARHAFGKGLYGGQTWPEEHCVLEGFSQTLSTKQIISALTAVGFSSPPNWLLPYNALSRGEQFRVGLAHAILSGGNLVAFDEFSNGVDRTVAKIGSEATANMVRTMGRKFVAVTCHYDVVGWLGPDWILDMATGKLARGRLRRPSIALAVSPCARGVWELFKRHHYLSDRLHPGCQCYVATLQERPVAFCAVLHSFGQKNRIRISRLVAMPEYQGIGIGVALLDWCAQRYHELGKRVGIVASHPAVIRHCERSRTWCLAKVWRTGTPPHASRMGTPREPKPTRRPFNGRPVVGFEFLGEK